MGTETVLGKGGKHPEKGDNRYNDGIMTLDIVPLFFISLGRLMDTLFYGVFFLFFLGSHFHEGIVWVDHWAFFFLFFPFHTCIVCSLLCYNVYDSSASSLHLAAYNNYSTFLLSLLLTCLCSVSEACVNNPPCMFIVV